VHGVDIGQVIVVRRWLIRLLGGLYVAGDAGKQVVEVEWFDEVLDDPRHGQRHSGARRGRHQDHRHVR